MKKRNRILAMVVAVVVVGGVAWLMLRPREPVYRGKTLTAWLEQDVVNAPVIYQNAPPGYEAEKAKRARARAEAEDAVRHIGTNALPYLVKIAEAKDSPLKAKLSTVLGKQSVIPVHFRWAMEYHSMSRSGFEILRSEAAPAVPDLIKLFSSRATNGIMASVPDNAVNCLCFIGETAVPYLLPLFTNSDPSVRFYATEAAMVIAPRLAYLAGADENETNRGRMIDELAEIGGPDPEMAEVLTNALKDKSFLVRSAATNALKRIEAEATSKAGMK